MQIDLHTLWYLTVGTLLVSAALVLWERQAHPRRARELACLGGSLLVFAAGCVIGLNRGLLPGASGSALTNLVMVSGYLTVLHGAARFDGPGRPGWSAAAVAALALTWALIGVHYPQAFWNHVGSLPIAVICGLTARTLRRSPALRGLRSLPIAVAISAGHGLFYLARGALVPVLAGLYGDDLLALVARVTMYEAALYAVAMPMAFLALVREEAQGDLLALSRTDHLTGLANRHGFFAQAEAALAAPQQEPLALLAADLDHFKTINDHHGHAVGDAVLAAFAETARRVAGPGAIAGRLGGEEFALLLPGHATRAAQGVAEALARGFAEEVGRVGAAGLAATVSIGVAERDTGREGLADLLARADRALYRAKALGRNRVEVAEPGFLCRIEDDRPRLREAGC